MRNILITGGLGYIGGRVANYLMEKGENDNIWITTRNKARKLPSWTEKFRVLELDLLDRDSLEKCFENIDVDIIIHLAALNEIESMKSPDLALAVNTMGTYNLLSWAIDKKVKGFIYFSTFHVYGETPDSTITEKTLTQPFHPYAITHLAAEDFIRFFQHYHGLSTLIFRLSNAYGCPMHKEVNRWTLVFNDLCKQAVVKRKITLRSSGKQYRDFISLPDVARAVYHFISLGPDNWGDGLYNLGGNCNMSIFEAAQKVVEIYSDKYDEEPISIEVGAEDNTSRWMRPFTYSIDKLKGTGFQLESSMEAEIAGTMEVCEEFMDERV
jgi:UDP-glucose 4-epimerase